MRQRIFEATASVVLLALAVGTGAAQCIGDANNNGFVNFADYGAVAQNFGQPCSPETRFVDNGNGTITDTHTGLMWEKLSDDLSVHDKDSTYTWADAQSMKVAALNATAFGGNTDWRMPTANELHSLLDYTRYNPTVREEFDNACVTFCTVVTCSCTGGNWHWTADEGSGAVGGISADHGWSVDFRDGDVDHAAKSDSRRVRAVRKVN